MAREDDMVGFVEAPTSEVPARREPIAEPAEASARGTGDPAWTGHTLDIRLSLWTPLGRVYLVVIGGPERRAPERRRRERKRHPLLTVGNVLVMIGFAAILVLAAMLGSAGGIQVARWLLAA